MSLPRGIVNRPPAAATHPKVVVGVVRWVWWLLALLLPLMLVVAFQVPGTRWRRDAALLQQEITQVRLARRDLFAEKARLLAPERLRAEAQRLNLSAPLPGDGPWPVAHAPKPQPRPVAAAQVTPVPAAPVAPARPRP